jgi:hypothetical protein
MNADGSDPKQITWMGEAIRTPSFGPDGAYIIFASRDEGESDIFIIDTEGEHEAVRVTQEKGLDRRPTLHRKRLAWTSDRTSNGEAQVFFADWNHRYARYRLGLPLGKVPKTKPRRERPRHEIRSGDLRALVRTLASDEMEGRRTGTRGGLRATQYAAEVLAAVGLEPTFDVFEFTAEVAYGTGNRFGRTDKDTFALDEQWRPAPFSKGGEFDPAPMVFAGFGIAVADHDSYEDLAVKDKWVMVLEGAPPGMEGLGPHADLRSKAQVALDRGARGLIVTGSTLISRTTDAALTPMDLAIVSITDEVADELLQVIDRSLRDVVEEFETGRAIKGFPMPEVTLDVGIEIEPKKLSGRNVYARIPGTTGKTVVIGAHVDHLGSDLSTGEEVVRYGADDNASGVAAVLEIAAWLAHVKPKLRHTVLLAIWSGKEEGLLGSRHFDKTGVVACLNLDGIGRFDRCLFLQGTGSSPIWLREIERANLTIRLPVTTEDDPFVATDSEPFYVKGIPILNATTGDHADHGTPGDTAEKLDYTAMEQVTRLMARLVVSLARMTKPLPYLKVEEPKKRPRPRVPVTLGMVPEFGAQVKGVRLSEVEPDGPADEIGLEAGDVVVELGGRKIEDVYDYVAVLATLKPDEPVSIVVVRSEQRMTLEITPE